MPEDKKRTMKFLGLDGWSRPVYKCTENGYLWKDVNLGKGEVCLCNADDFDGEPDSAIRKDLIVEFLDGPAAYTRAESTPMDKLQQEAREEYIKEHGRTPEEDGVIVTKVK